MVLKIGLAGELDNDGEEKELKVTPRYFGLSTWRNSSTTD